MVNTASEMEVRHMDTYQAISLMIAFAALVIQIVRSKNDK